MQNTKQIVIILVSVLCILGCREQEFMYNLTSPDESMQLGKKLNEISGLELLSDSAIVSIQDEKAIIYYLDATTGKITDQFDFGKNGDYEGIAHFKNQIYTLRSDGSIFKVISSKETIEYKFKHNENFDFEGLCLDQSNARLLVACKEHGKKEMRDHFFIYSFSLESKKYDKKPLFKIKKKLVSDNFKPSAIAIDPNGNIYVLSSFSKTLLVLSSRGTILNNIKLSETIFPQPEGITFNANGDLFISNEKNNRTPTILKFNKLNKKE